MDAEKFRKALAKLLSRRPEAAARLKEAKIGIGDLERYLARTELNRTEAVTSAAAESMPDLPTSVVGLVESIIEEVGRPTLFVTGNDYELPADEELARRLKAARAVLSLRLPSVGRVEVFDGSLKWPIGTAWMVAENIAITNRHVAEHFATIDEAGKPVLLTDLRGRPYKVAIDFREEHGSIEESELAVAEILYLPRRSGNVSDIALLRMADGQSLPPPIPLLSSRIPVDSWIAVVGYPQPDDRIPPEAREIEESYFSNIYGVKRLSPGQVDDLALADAPDWLTRHDATTLGGNSGSVLLDLATGSAAGIHFKGEFKKANYAVHSEEIRRVLSEHGITSAQVTPTRPPREEPALVAGEDEAAENLDTFSGYAADFIDTVGDEDFEIAIPAVTERAPGAVAKLNGGDSALRYRNFSVVMNSERRLCYFSAVNIDGKRTFSIKGARPQWRKDRRLDEALQIKDECYGRGAGGQIQPWTHDAA